MSFLSNTLWHSWICKDLGVVWTIRKGVHAKILRVLSFAGASFTFLCHFYCKLSHSFMVHFWKEKKKKREKKISVVLVLFPGFLCLSMIFFNVPYNRLIEHTWWLWILHVDFPVVLSKCAFQTLRNMIQGKLSVSFRGQLACCVVFTYCNLTVR